MKRMLAMLLCLLLLTSCGLSAGEEDTAPLSIVAATYPIYLLADAVTETAENVTLSALISQDISCLHDYTLTVNEMKLLEGADVLILSGAGLDDFVLEAIAGLPEEARPAVIDCSEFVELLPLTDSRSNALEGEVDPHYWLDPSRALLVVQGLSMKLASLDPKNNDAYRLDAGNAMAMLVDGMPKLQAMVENVKTRKLITFHDGFSYLAAAFDFDLLLAVEEEEGQEASAQVIQEALALIETHNLPAIFTEVSSADATAQAIGREAEVAVVPLSMLMSGGEGTGALAYLTAMAANLDAIAGALG